MGSGKKGIPGVIPEERMKEPDTMVCREIIKSPFPEMAIITKNLWLMQ